MLFLQMLLLGVILFILMFNCLRPPEGTVLINVDAALFNPSRWMGICVVIRDHNGVCLTASSELCEEVTAPELAEALV
jgi:hypothetical protein